MSEQGPRTRSKRGRSSFTHFRGPRATTVAARGRFISSAISPGDTPHNFTLVLALTVAALGVPYIRASSPKLPPSPMLVTHSLFTYTCHIDGATSALKAPLRRRPLTTGFMGGDTSSSRESERELPAFCWFRICLASSWRREEGVEYSLRKAMGLSGLEVHSWTMQSFSSC
ncbi:hypothetical protein EYF80_015163 [Liparis tanakae]|uniref:Uncharacterized protein n=1 Tax=Liparis tanakae TaxID=230148 RepID=A0A4Z2I9B3_9TELE|nr:hypothetical protein EYF80_015163 [Liparis tanakae]